jgi:hypothetical protein
MSKPYFFYFHNHFLLFLNLNIQNYPWALRIRFGWFFFYPSSCSFRSKLPTLGDGEGRRPAGAPNWQLRGNFVCSNKKRSKIIKGIKKSGLSILSAEETILRSFTETQCLMGISPKQAHFIRGQNSKKTPP